MKKAMMVVSIISLSLLLSDLSFAKKKKKRKLHKDGVVATTVRGGVGVVDATGNAAVGITRGAVNTTGNILKSL